MLVGNKIKTLRKAQKMKLKELAEKSGVQIATLSRMEHLKMIGTVESHGRIAQALGVALTELYKGVDLSQPATSPAPKSDLPETFSYNSKASSEIITGNIFNKKMLPSVLRLEPSGQTSVEQNKPGTEKFVFVLEGDVTLKLGTAEIKLKASDTMYFSAAVSHQFVNVGETVAKIIAVVTPVEL
jgi:transcriptional regulator with XRE-family HTH domain